jgi:hypothetical protein
MHRITLRGDIPAGPSVSYPRPACRVYGRPMELYWWSIEVLDGPSGSARGWQDARGNALTEAAITNGAHDWRWQAHTWGVLFEIAFASDERWQVYRDLPAVRAALDAVPDPVNGLLIYPGRGGSAGKNQPRTPRPRRRGGRRAAARGADAARARGRGGTPAQRRGPRRRLIVGAAGRPPAQ